MRFRTFFASALGVCCGLAGMAPTTGEAQSLQLTPVTGVSDRPAARAVRVVEGPSLDGDVANDVVWQQAAPIGWFLQYQPNEGQPVSETTEVRMVFTRDTLYVGVICYDREPDAIIVADSRRDSSLDNSDSFRMIFDTFRDRQNGFVFGTNPAGIEYDAQVTNEGQGGGGLQGQSSGSGSGFNINWDGAWEVRTKTTEIGWMAEFAIPFKTLRYPEGSNQTWGVNFQRNIRRRNEESYWARIPRQFNLNRVSIAGTIGGIEPPTFRNFKLIPYMLGQLNTVGERPVNGVTLGNVGGDAKYNLTPSLTLDATYNTDFAQVEVDDQQVNLDRFNLFFPEKRPFFLENAGFFSVGNPGEVDLFFSRRIGLSSSGQAIPLYGGGRVSGKVGLWNVGALNMQTEEAPGFAVPSNNFGVLRLSRELPNRTAVGGIFINRQGFGTLARNDDFNRTFAVDGKLGVGRSHTVSGFLAKTQTPGRVGRDHAMNLRARILYPKYDFDLGYQEVGDAFNPEVGFLTRGGYRKPDVRLFTRFRPKKFLRLQEIRPHATYRGFWGFDNFHETGYAHIDSHWQFKDSSEIHTGMNLTHEGVRTPFEIFPGVIVPPGMYDHQEAQLVFTTNQGAPISLNLQTYIGGFFGGSRVTTNPTLRIRTSETFNMEMAYSRNDVKLPQGEFVTNLLRTRVSYAFSARMFVQSLVQYNDRADIWSVNLRFGWLQAANTGLFVVYNDARGLYELFPDRPLRTDRSLIIKFSRMFDVLR
ncbi:MAG: DUF5916 domain-containing protein [Vicinamibacterales bacterium]